MNRRKMKEKLSLFSYKIGASRRKKKTYKYKILNEIESRSTWCTFCKKARWWKNAAYGYCKNPDNLPITGSGNNYYLSKIIGSNRENRIRDKIWVANKEECRNFVPNICYCKELLKYDRTGNYNRVNHSMCKENKFKDIKLPIWSMLISILAIIISILLPIILK
jgi:hypothetical protein